MYSRLILFHSLILRIYACYEYSKSLPDHLKFLFYSTEEFPFSWTAVKEILAHDDLTRMEIELTRFGGSLKKIENSLNGPIKKTIFHGAVEYGASKCLRYLISKANARTSMLDDPDVEGRTPLHYAIEYGYYVSDQHSHLDCTKILLEKGAYVNARDKYGDTALHNIFQMKISKPSRRFSRFQPFLQVLLSQPTIDVKAKNKLDQTPLDLKLHFSDAENMKDPLYEIFMNSSKVKKAESRKETRFQSLLYNSLMSDDQITRKGMCDRIKEIESISNVYIGSETILYLLTKQHNANVLEKALAKGLNPWICNISDDKLPLHIALQRGNVGNVRILLSYMIEDHSKWIELGNQSFELLKTVTCNAYCPKFKNSYKKIDHLKCLSLLLESSIPIDVNATRDTLSKLSVLSIAKNAQLLDFVNIFSKYVDVNSSQERTHMGKV